MAEAAEVAEINPETCEVSRPNLRFLITVCYGLKEKEDILAFIQKASAIFGVSKDALANRISAEMDDEVEFGEDELMPGVLPAVYVDLQQDTEEAKVERDKLQMVSGLVRLGGETLDDILSVMDNPIVKFCPFCKYLGYNKDHYLNHNFKGGHNEEVICPASIYMTNDKLEL